MTVRVHPSWLCSDCRLEGLSTCGAMTPCWGTSAEDLGLDLTRPLDDQLGAAVLPAEPIPSEPHPSWAGGYDPGALGCSHGKGWAERCHDCRTRVDYAPWLHLRPRWLWRLTRRWKP